MPRINVQVFAHRIILLVMNYSVLDSKSMIQRSLAGLMELKSCSLDVTVLWKDIQYKIRFNLYKDTGFIAKYVNSDLKKIESPWRLSCSYLFYTNDLYCNPPVCRTGDLKNRLRYFIYVICVYYISCWLVFLLVNRDCYVNRI